MAAVNEFPLHQQIASLRREKGITQEELAAALGVTNQAVSKWESGICCPDIQLLPALAAYFEVTTDRLLGCEKPDGEEELRMQLRRLMDSLPREDVFPAAYRLAAQLHDGVCRKMGFVPWNTDQPFSREDGAVWGCSVCSEPEGTTIHHSGTVLMADGQFQKKPSGEDEAKIRAVLESLCRPNVLRVLFVLSSLTSEDYLNAVTLEELAIACRLPEDRAASALDDIPLEYVENTVEPYFRLAGSYRHMPVLLSLLSMN